MTATEILTKAASEKLPSLREQELDLMRRRTIIRNALDLPGMPTRGRDDYQQQLDANTSALRELRARMGK